jgi:MbtH protein
MFDEDDGRTYLVVVNHEGQYSIWPDSRQVPAGWRPVGPRGIQAGCVAYIDEVWTDLRPASLRPDPPGAAAG